jgi:hypothetical protein
MKKNYSCKNIIMLKLKTYMKLNKLFIHHIFIIKSIDHKVIIIKLIKSDISLLYYYDKQEI